MVNEGVEFINQQNEAFFGLLEFAEEGFEGEGSEVVCLADLVLLAERGVGVGIDELGFEGLEGVLPEVAGGEFLTQHMRVDEGKNHLVSGCTVEFLAGGGVGDVVQEGGFTDARFTDEGGGLAACNDSAHDSSEWARSV